MTRGRLIAVMAAIIVVMGIALVRTATATHDASHKAFSGGTGFRGLVVKTDLDPISITTFNSEWQTVDSRGFQIPANESQLIAVDFVAETRCVGTGTGRCSTRVLVGKTLGTAQSLEPASENDFAIDTAGEDSRESHAMSRALCVRNGSGAAINVSVWLQATGNTNGSTVTTFELDDWTFKIARNAPCSPSVDI